MFEEIKEFLKNSTATEQDFKECLKVFSAIETDIQMYNEKLKERTQFYKDENVKMKTIIEKLKLIHENMQYPSLPEEASDVDDVSRDCCMLSQQEMLRKHNYYTSKVKYCIKMYSNLNEKLLDDIKMFKTEIDNAKSKLNCTNAAPRDELKYLEAKVKRYENELIKLERKHPWLKNSQLNLPDIAEQIGKLNNLRHMKEKLIEDLAIYKGLKPDIAEANKQLKEVKMEYKQIMDEIQKLSL